MAIYFKYILSLKEDVKENINFRKRIIFKELIFCLLTAWQCLQKYDISNHFLFTSAINVKR